MPDFQLILSAIASLLCFFYFFPYLLAIFKGKTRPNRASWWIWGINGLVMCASYYSSGGRQAIWALLAPVVVQLIVAVIALKYGEGGWRRFDQACLVGVGLSFIVWWQFGTPIVALSMSLSIDFLGALPTLRKSWLDPKSENLTAWMIYAIGSALNLFTIEAISLEALSAPLYVFLINATIAALLARPQRSKPRPA